MKRIRTQQGFTLIELVMVIVILGILAATAIPKFVNLSAQAQEASVKGIAGGLASAHAINYATSAAGGTATGILDCNLSKNLLLGGVIPTSMSIASVTLTAGSSATCQLTDGTTTIDFVGFGV